MLAGADTGSMGSGGQMLLGINLLRKIENSVSPIHFFLEVYM